MSGRLDPAVRERLLAKNVLGTGDAVVVRALSPYAEGVPDDPLAASMYLDSRLALVDALLHYFDHASMAHSLEVRVPFLDQRVVELCATIPSNLKVRRLTTKYLLRRAVRGLIPDAVLDKRKIGFFRHAADAWFRSQLDRSIERYLLCEEPRFTEFLDEKAVRDLIAEHTRGDGARHGELLLAILMLEVWLTSYLPRALERPPELSSISRD